MSEIFGFLMGGYVNPPNDFNAKGFWKVVTNNETFGIGESIPS